MRIAEIFKSKKKYKSEDIQVLRYLTPTLRINSQDRNIKLSDIITKE